MMTKSLFKFKVLVFSLFVGVTLPSVTYAKRQCEHLFIQNQNYVLHKDLTDIRYYDTRDADIEKVQLQNIQLLEELKNDIPNQTTDRLQSVSVTEADRIQNSIYNNPVASPDVIDKYERPNTNIGYCFGRATYYHLLLLKLGVSKQSIRKIWAVGPMKTPNGILWSYHVATIVYTKDRGWLVLDPNSSKTESVSQWMEIYSEMSTDSKLKFYVTHPSKFGVDSDKYSRKMLGLDSDVNNDWFSHYFKNLVASLKEQPTERLLQKKYFWGLIKF